MEIAHILKSYRVGTVSQFSQGSRWFWTNSLISLNVSFLIRKMGKLLWKIQIHKMLNNAAWYIIKTQKEVAFIFAHKNDWHFAWQHQWGGYEATGILIHCWWTCTLVQPFWKTVWLRKAEHLTSNSTPGIYPTELHTYVTQKPCTEWSWKHRLH